MPPPASSTRVVVSDLAQGRYRLGDRGFSFVAAHRLTDVPAGHRAARSHGHTFTVEVELADTELRAPGFVADYAELAPVGAYLKRELDHRDLNTLFTFDTTTDTLAQHITTWFLAHMPPERGRQLHNLQVSIGATSAAHQQGDDDPFGFEAAHHLDGLPDGHKCGRLHGHSYRVDLRVAPDASPRCRASLRSALAGYLDQELDHRDLNEVLAFQPTSELLAEHLYFWTLDQATALNTAGVEAVRVWESPRRWAEFTQAEWIGR